MILTNSYFKINTSIVVVVGCMTVWLHDCMTVDTLDKLDSLEDMLDMLHMSHRGGRRRAG